MTKLMTALICIGILLHVACRNGEEELVPRIETSPTIAELRFNSTIYVGGVKAVHNSLFEGQLGFKIDSFTVFSHRKGSIKLFNLLYQEGTQNLVKNERWADPRDDRPTAMYFILDDDVLLGRYDLDESYNNHFEVTNLDTANNQAGFFFNIKMKATEKPYYGNWPDSILISSRDTINTRFVR